MADDFESLYAGLRATFLARHFSLSCYARADLFDMEAHLGVRRRADDRDSKASPGGITWARPTRPRPRGGSTAPGAVFVPPAFLYGDAADFEKKLRAGDLGEEELWRWAKHDRTNALLMTGVRLIQLSIEAKLGGEESLRVILRTMKTMRALLRFDHAGVDVRWRGYMLRWDPVASDLWETKPGARGHVELVQNHEFLLNGDPKRHSTGDHYLYCTPLDDPRYRDAIANHGDEQRGRDRYRRWEPSMDEYVGVTVGLYMVWFCLRERTDAAARDAVAHASYIADRVGTYLRETGYFLVRPHGGFAFRGALDMAPAQEYPIARALAAITGNPPDHYISSREATLERALRMAGHGADYDEASTVSSEVRGEEVGRILDEMRGDVPAWIPGEFVDAAIERVLSFATSQPANLLAVASMLTGAGRAAAVAERLDIKADQMAQKRAMVAFCHVLNWLSRNHPGNVADAARGPAAVYGMWMRSPTTSEGSPADGFKPLLALTCLHESSDDHPVARAYRAFFDAQVDSASAGGRAEVRDGVRAGNWVASRAIRLLLAAGNDNTGSLAARLEEELVAMRDALLELSRGRPALITANVDVGADVPGAPKGTVAERYDTRSVYMGYSVTLALAWLVEHLGIASFDRFSTPDAGGIREWPTPVVPRSVVLAASNGALSVPVRTAIMRGTLPEGLPEYPLLKDPPDRPASLGAPPPPLEVHARRVPEGEPATFVEIVGIDLGASHQTFRYRPPSVDAARRANGYVLIVAGKRDLVMRGVKQWQAKVEDDEIVVEVEFEQGWNPLRRGRPGRSGQFQVELTTAWVRSLP